MSALSDKMKEQAKDCPKPYSTWLEQLCREIDRLEAGDTVELPYVVSPRGHVTLSEASTLAGDTLCNFCKHRYAGNAPLDNCTRANFRVTSCDKLEASE